MIRSEQEWRGENHCRAVTQVGLEYMPRASAEYDFLAVSNEGNAEHNIGPVEPAGRLRVGPKQCCRQQTIDGPSDPAADIMISEDDGCDP